MAAGKLSLTTVPRAILSLVKNKLSSKPESLAVNYNYSYLFFQATESKHKEQLKTELINNYSNLVDDNHILLFANYTVFIIKLTDISAIEEMINATGGIRKVSDKIYVFDLSTLKLK